jgi:hypothetical protein
VTFKVAELQAALVRKTPTGWCVARWSSRRCIRARPRATCFCPVSTSAPKRLPKNFTTYGPSGYRFRRDDQHGSCLRLLGSCPVSNDRACLSQVGYDSMCGAIGWRAVAAQWLPV